MLCRQIEELHTRCSSEARQAQEARDTARLTEVGPPPPALCVCVCVRVCVCVYAYCCPVFLCITIWREHYFRLQGLQGWECVHREIPQCLNGGGGFCMHGGAPCFIDDGMCAERC